MTKFLFIISLVFAAACAADQSQFTASPDLGAHDRSGAVAFQIQDVAFAPGATVEAKFKVTGFTDIASFQFAMQFDTSKLSYSHTTFTGAIPDFNLECCFGMQELGYWVEPGEVRVGWVHYGAGGITLPDNTECFSMFFTAKTSGNLSAAFPFWPNNIIFPPEASDSGGNILPLSVNYLPIPASGNAGNAGNTKKKKKH